MRLSRADSAKKQSSIYQQLEIVPPNHSLGALRFSSCRWIRRLSHCCFGGQVLWPLARRTRTSMTKGPMCGRGTSGKHLHDHLLAAQERVADELASSQGDGGVVVGHLRGCRRCRWACCGKSGSNTWETLQVGVVNIFFSRRGPSEGGTGSARTGWVEWAAAHKAKIECKSGARTSLVG